MLIVMLHTILHFIQMNMSLVCLKVKQKVMMSHKILYLNIKLDYVHLVHVKKQVMVQ